MLGVGLVGGVFSGLLGVGGGIVMVPLLVLAFGFGQRTAHALSLAAIIPIAVVGAATYAAEGELDLPVAAALALGAIVGAKYGASALARIDEGRLKVVFGVFLVGVAVSVAVGT
jgi:hypothetical protein